MNKPVSKFRQVFNKAQEVSPFCDWVGEVFELCSASGAVFSEIGGLSALETLSVE